MGKAWEHLSCERCQLDIGGVGEVLGGGAPTLLLASEFLFVETRLV